MGVEPMALVPRAFFAQLNDNKLEPKEQRPVAGSKWLPEGSKQEDTDV